MVLPEYRTPAATRQRTAEANQRYRDRRGVKRQQRDAELKPTAECIAYAAGFIDGEGYIGALIKSAGPYVSARVAISGVVVAPLVFMQRRWGGVIGSHAAYQPNRRDASNWVLTRKSLIVNLLADVRPLLLVKGAQADLVLELAALPKLVRGQPCDELVARRIAIYEELRRLNRRGRGGDA